MERFSTHISDDLSRDDTRSRASPKRGDGVNGTPRRGHGGGNGIHDYAGVAASDGKQVDSARSDASFTLEDEEALREALDRSTQHLNGVPCFLLQAYRSYGKRMQHPDVLWAQVVASVDQSLMAAAATGVSLAGLAAAGGSHAGNNGEPDTAARNLFDELVVSAARGDVCVRVLVLFRAIDLAVMPAIVGITGSRPSTTAPRAAVTLLRPTAGVGDAQHPGAALPSLPAVGVLQAVRQHAAPVLQPDQVQQEQLRVAEGEGSGKRYRARVRLLARCTRTEHSIPQQLTPFPPTT